MSVLVLLLDIVLCPTTMDRLLARLVADNVKALSSTSFNARNSAEASLIRLGASGKKYIDAIRANTIDTETRKRLDRVWVTLNYARPLLTFQCSVELPAQASAVAVSSAGKEAFVACIDGSFQQFDTASPQARVVFRIQGYFVTTLFACPDHKHVVAATDDGGIDIWNVDRRTIETSMKMREGFALSVLTDPASKFVVSAGTDGKIHIWDLGTGKHVRDWRAHDRTINQITMIGPPHDRLFSCGEDGAIRCWLWDGKSVWSVGARKPARCMIQTDQRIIVGRESGEIGTYSIVDGALISSVELGGAACTASVLRSGLVTLGDENGLLWSSKQFGRESVPGVSCHTNAVRVMAGSLQGEIVLTGCFKERRVVVWREANQGAR